MEVWWFGFKNFDRRYTLASELIRLSVAFLRSFSCHRANENHKRIRFLWKKKCRYLNYFLKSQIFKFIEYEPCYHNCQQFYLQLAAPHGDFCLSVNRLLIAKFYYFISALTVICFWLLITIENKRRNPCRLIFSTDLFVTFNHGSFEAYSQCPGTGRLCGWCTANDRIGSRRCYRSKRWSSLCKC